MRVLVHVCCGPCSITVLRHLLEEGHEVTGFFFNPNIHPLAEYMRRRQGAQQVAERLAVPLILADTLPEPEQRWVDAWGGGEPVRESLFGCEGTRREPPALPVAADPRPWLRAVAGREHTRCEFCWRMRLRATAEFARRRGFEGFTSSLLYSRYQRHERITALGEALAGACSMNFVYHDFRRYWQEGICLSKEWGIYRQQYCGCLFSEYERYSRDFAALRGK